MMRAAALAVLCVLSNAAYARDPEGKYANSPLHEWYEQQRNSAGMVCCNEADAHPYFGDYHIQEDGSVMLENGETIEAYKVLKGANPTGHPVWWFIENAWGKTTYCFMPGSMT